MAANQWLSGPFKGIEVSDDLFPYLFMEGIHQPFKVEGGLPDDATFYWDHPK